MNMAVEGLERWYAARSNGDGEHSFGVRIAMLDNPGWRLTRDLAGIPLPEFGFEPISVD